MNDSKIKVLLVEPEKYPKEIVRNSYSSNLKEIKKENTKTFFCSIDKSAPVPTSDKSINEAENLRALEQLLMSLLNFELSNIYDMSLTLLTFQISIGLLNVE